MSLRELSWGVVRELTRQPHTNNSSCSRKQTAENGEEMYRDVCLLHPWQAFVTVCAPCIVVSGQNSKLCSRSEAQTTQQNMQGVCLQGFSPSVNSKWHFCLTIVSTSRSVCTCCTCLSVFVLFFNKTCLGYPVRIWRACWARSTTGCPTWGSSERNFR